MFSLSVFFCLFQEARAQLRQGRRKHPPVTFASLGLSVMWTQRMFGEFTHTYKKKCISMLETADFCQSLVTPVDLHS